MIEDRKAGKGGSYFEDSSDLMSILLGNEAFTGQEEKIIDEIIVLFFAGSRTVQMTMTNIICYMNKHKQMYAKLQAEVDSNLGPI